MATLDPSTAVRDQLEAALPAETFKRGPVRPTPDVVAQAAFVIPTGGPGPEPFNNAGNDFGRPTVQVRSRAAKSADSITFAIAIRDALNKKPPAGFVECRALETGPILLGLDDQGNTEYSQNFTLWGES